MNDKWVPKYRRVVLGVEYNGACYKGFQSQQTGVRTVQDELQRALSWVADEGISLVVAGRTDAGVHACGQVVHFDTTAVRQERSWVMGANAELPPDISVTWAREVPEDFHARFSAVARRYRYVIYNDPIRPALLNRELTWNYRPLDIEAMREAARHFIGTHDFSAFRASQCQAKSPVKTLHHFEIYQWGSLIVLDVRANAFLHHMVRNFAGLLMTIGAGERSPRWAKEVLDRGERRQGGVTAPPYGLYLVQVEYPQCFDLPQRCLGPYFLSGLSCCDIGREAGSMTG